MENIFSSVEGNSFSEITYYNANRSNGIFKGFHVCDFAIVFRMSDGYLWNICFNGEFDYYIEEGSDLSYGKIKKNAVETFDATSLWSGFTGLRIKEISFEFCDDEGISVSACNVIFENGKSINLVIGEEPGEDNSLPSPLEYYSPGVIYIFVDEEMFSDLFLEAEGTGIDEPEFMDDITAFNICNSAGIEITPFIMNNREEVTLANDIFAEIEVKLDFESEASSNSRLFQNCLNNCDMIKEYEYVNIYSSFRLSGTTDEAHLLLVGLSYYLDGSKYRTSYHEYQIMGLKLLNHDYGHLKIRPETIEDKFREIFSKRETDFKKFPEFSFKYYVLHDKGSFAGAFETDKRLEIIQDMDDIYIEVYNNVLIAKFPRILNLKDCSDMIDFLERI